MPGKISFIQHNITSLFPGKTPFQEGSFMKVNYILLISLLIVGLLCVPAVSADEVLVNEIVESYVETGGVYSHTVGGAGTSSKATNVLWINDITKYPYFGYLVVEFEGNTAPSVTDGRSEFTYYFNGEDRPGYVYKATETDLFGAVTKTKLTIFLDNWDIGTLTGTQTITLPFLSNTISVKQIVVSQAPPVYLAYASTDNYAYAYGNQYTLVAGDYYAASITITDTANPAGYLVKLNRTPYNQAYTSTINISLDDEVVLSNTAHGTPFESWFPSEALDLVEVIFGNGRSYPYTLGGGSSPSSSPTVTVYVQNSQTGALIADTNLNVNLYETETWYNSTLEWGWDTIQLPAGNYEFYAEKSGYTQYAPGRLTVDGVGDNINLLLYPDVAAPPAGNLTLQFWVCDSNSNGIPYAELSVIGLAGEGAYYDSGIIQTNNLGYATLIAPGNSTYTAYASKPGYTAGENEFGVTTVSPVHIAVMLMAGEIPTNPTPTPPGVTPTVTPTVRPTDVAPGNNPIDNFRIMFLNMGFDDAFSDWLTGLFIVCIGAALGYGVAKKFGAMCGAPIGLVTATGLGLIPIWALVLIIVIVALAYAKFIMGR